jgi:uncharacterized protein (DUF58 family)
MIFTWRGVLGWMLTVPLLALTGWWGWAWWLLAGWLLLWLVILAVDWWAAGSPQHFHIQRKHEAKFSLNAANPVTLHLQQYTRFSTKIWLRDDPPAPFDCDQLIHTGTIAPAQTWQTAYHLTPFQRGNYHFSQVHLRWLSPLRLLIRQAKFALPSEVRVYPNIKAIRQYDLLMQNNRVQEMGLRKVRKLGAGNEFERLREYAPDDEYRHIHWKATARRNFPVVAQFQTERSQHILAVVDSGRMMGSPVGKVAKLDYVLNAVLLFSYVAVSKGDRVGLLTFAADVRQYLPPKAGRTQFFHMLEALYALEPRLEEPDYRAALSHLRRKYPRRALVVIFTDLNGGFSMEQLLNDVKLLSRTHLPLVVTISDPDIVAMTEQIPTTQQQVYERAAAERLQSQRAVILQSLQAHGVLTLDVPAHQLSASVINRYLEIKEMGRL